MDAFPTIPNSIIRNITRIIEKITNVRKYVICTMLGILKNKVNCAVFTLFGGILMRVNDSQ